MSAISNTLAHCVEVVSFVDFAPIDAAFERPLQHEVEPDARGATVAFHKWVGDVHFDVLVDDFVKCRFRHSLDHWKRRSKVLRIGECEPVFRDVQGSYLPGEVIKSSEEIGVDLLETLHRPRFDTGQNAAFKESIRLFLTLPIDGAVE